MNTFVQLKSIFTDLLGCRESRRLALCSKELSFHYPVDYECFHNGNNCVACGHYTDNNYYFYRGEDKDFNFYKYCQECEYKVKAIYDKIVTTTNQTMILVNKRIMESESEDLFYHFYQVRFPRGICVRNKMLLHYHDETDTKFYSLTDDFIIYPRQPQFWLDPELTRIIDFNFIKYYHFDFTISRPIRTYNDIDRNYDTGLVYFIYKKVAHMLNFDHSTWVESFA